jgi:tetratricopeptide (TPR) repeat protein
MRHAVIFLLAIISLAGQATAQTRADRERARTQNKLGWEDMRKEAWEKAARSFQAAIDIDPQFEVPFYGLGRANMNLKKFPAAIAAYERCRDLYRNATARQFSNAQEAQRFRQDRITEIDEQIRQTQSGPMTPARQDLLRQLQNVRRDIQESIQRGNNMSIESRVPAWVSLALGSAYFRSGQLSDAEREYKATIAADSRSGEAHNNLAVVYFETGRYADAAASMQAAKKAGFRVNPELEKAIRDKGK